ncbi:NADP-specific glutamate dehydrogenase [Candidatus Dojkabacteria bacterium]|uniref:Glutamate dehydrogenase n=1 Tax=Candidatus Dojkabacteria bacterium TaxID=2099670 RepID=A0A955RKR9_9BACT|nr:NADP-specific glutamate dehydrogenase [Candidatus Dojkabacteria bacterium]
MNYSIQKFLKSVENKNPHQPEFMQTVEEVISSLEPLLSEHPEYFESKILERIVEPERIIQFRVTWVDDNGDVQINKGYRIQFNSALGPYKGGLRFHPSVNLSILKFLGFEQIFKNSLTGLPLGGGKGGSDFDPKGKSDQEIMRFCQAFMSELYRHIGPSLDVPAGDIGVGGTEVGYLFGMYKKLRNEFTGVLTGKPLESGGSLIRPEATGYGLLYFLNEMIEEAGDSIEGKTIAVSGSGNVAQFAVEKALELGAKVVTMSDSSGFIYDAEGITKEKLHFIMKLKNKEKARIQEYIKTYTSAQYLENKNPWSFAKYDVALPCATQNEITADDAQGLITNGVKYVAEGANMPSTNEAIELFKKNNVVFGPAKACNAGGVAVSGLEMSQNSLRLQWTREEVDEELKKIMSKIHAQCVEHGSTKKGVDYLSGANRAGFKRVADAMLQQGIM